MANEKELKAYQDYTGLVPKGIRVSEVSTLEMANQLKEKAPEQQDRNKVAGVLVETAKGAYYVDFRPYLNDFDSQSQLDLAFKIRKGYMQAATQQDGIDILTETAKVVDGESSAISNPKTIKWASQHKPFATLDFLEGNFATSDDTPEQLVKLGHNKFNLEQANQRTNGANGAPVTAKDHLAGIANDADLQAQLKEKLNPNHPLLAVIDKLPQPETAITQVENDRQA